MLIIISETDFAEVTRYRKKYDTMKRREFITLEEYMRLDVLTEERQGSCHMSV